MNNSIKRLLGYILGFSIINSAISQIGFKEYCLTTIGGLILIASSILFSDNKNKY